MSTRTALLAPVLFAVAACAASRPAAQPATSATSAPEPGHAPELAVGVRALDAGDYEGARASFEAAAKAVPRDAMALWDLGQACEKLGDGAAALAAYRAELEVEPDADQATAEIADLYVVDGRVDDALAIATRGLARRPGSAALHAALGHALATRGDRDAAMKQFEQSIQIEPTSAMRHFTFAVWLNKWHVRGAAFYLDRALALVHDDYPMTVSIGHEYRLAGVFDSCVSTFDAAIKSKDRGEPRTERALCKLGLRDEAGAFADLKGAVAAEPTYPQAHFFLAGRLAVAKRYREAAAEYQAYLQLAPDGSLADQATRRLRAAQDAAASERDAVAARPRTK